MTAGPAFAKMNVTGLFSLVFSLQFILGTQINVDESESIVELDSKSSSSELKLSDDSKSSSGDVGLSGDSKSSSTEREVTVEEVPNAVTISNVPAGQEVKTEPRLRNLLDTTSGTALLFFAILSFIVDLTLNSVLFANLITYKNNAQASCGAAGSAYLPSCAPGAQSDASNAGKIFLPLTTLSLIAMLVSTSLCYLKTWSSLNLGLASTFIPESIATVLISLFMILKSGQSLNHFCYEMDMMVAVKSVGLALTYIVAIVLSISYV